MILWTIQPLYIWEQIQENGAYICDPAKSSMPEYTEQYDWLVEKMTEKIGPPPDGVRYPVWAWYMQNGKIGKPDLRQERWSYGPGDEDYTCIELDVPDDQAVLSDFDLWSIVLLNALISENEEEDAALEKHYDSFSPGQKQAFKRKNWERIFDITPLKNGWIKRSQWIQATFWQLKKEYVRKVYYFKTGKRKLL